MSAIINPGGSGGGIAVTLSSNTAGVLALVSSGTLTLAGGNNITLSQAGNAITISAANETQTVPPIGTAVNPVATAGSTGTVTRFAPEDHRHAGLVSLGISGGNTAGNSSGGTLGSVLFAGGNNITLSQVSGAGGATITVSGPNAQTAISGIAASNTTYTSGTVTITGVGGGVTVSSNTGQRVDISVATPVPIGTSINPVASASSVGTVTRYAAEDHRHQGVGTIGVSTGGNTAGNTGTTLGQVIFAGGNNITLSQVTAAGGLATITISAANETQTVPPIGTAVNAVATAGSTGTVTRFAPEDHRHAGIGSFGVSTGGNTAGNTGTTVGQVVLAGGNNITLSQSTAAGGVATITISAANETQTVPPIGTAVNAVDSAGSTGTITRFAPEDHRHEGIFSAGVSTGGNTAGNTSVGPGQFVLAGGANITLSQATAAGKLMTVSVVGGAGAAAVAISAGAQSVNSGTVIFSNSNGISFGMSGSQTITASYTVPTVTNSSWTVSDAATSGTVARLAFTNLNGVTLSLSSGAGGSHTIVGSHNALTSQSNQAFSAAGGSSAFQTLSFADTNSVSFTNTGGSVGVASVKLQMFAVSNTTQSSSGTANHTALSFGGAGIASVGVTGGSVVISVPSGGGAVVSNAIQDVGTATGSGTNTSRFAADDHIHRGVLGLVASGTASTFYGAVTIGTGNLIALSTAGASTAGSINIHVGLSAATTASQVTTVNTVGTRVTRFALEDHQHAGVAAFAAGSNTGNTTGNTASQFGTWVLAASTNVTVSGSTGAAGVHTAWLSVADPGAGAAMSVGISTQGNTAGDAGYNTRRANLVGSNAITLSQATTTGGSGTITILGPASATTASQITTTNVVGTRGSRFALEDHQHLGVAGAGVISGGGGITAGTTGFFPGSFGFQPGLGLVASGGTNANGVTAAVAVAAGLGAYADVATATAIGTNFTSVAMAAHAHRGIRGIVASGTATTFFGDMVLSGGNNITLSTGGASTAGSIAIHGRAGPDVQYWANIGPGSTTTHLNDAQLHLSPMWGGFPGYITVSGAGAAVTAFFSGVSNASMSASHTLSMQFGIYQLSNSTALSALATCSTVFSTGVATVANSNSYHGVRMVSLPGSVWGGTASSFALTPGNYWWGVWIRSSGSSHVATGIKILGGAPVGNNFSVFSGMMGQSTNTTRAMAPFWGVVRYVGSSTQGSLQTSVALTQMQNATTTDRMMYQYIAIGGTELGTF